MRPLIGISTSEVRVPDHVSPKAQSDPPRREMALGMKYCVAIEAAGGLPVVMPPLDSDDVAPLVGRLSAICLSGGPDINPGTYGGHYHPQLGPTEPQLDTFELALVHTALEREVPLLAICRGAQILNVALGGDLYQHLPEDPGGPIQHRKPTPDAPDAKHDVEVEEGSLLSRALGLSGTAHVNSYHHQAAHTLGRGLHAVAHAPDGVIEAIELPERAFVIGVQWHAEALIERPEQASLFEAFVSAAADRDSAAARAA
jgi:putative glutamine amidotransferase